MNRRAVVIGGALSLAGAARWTGGGKAAPVGALLTPVPEDPGLGEERATVVPPPRPASATDDGDSARTGAPASPAASGGVSGVSGGTYTSPTHGYALDFDPAVWAVEEETTAVDAGYDLLRLSNGTSAIEVRGDPDYAGDAVACVEDYGGQLGSMEGVVEAEPTGDEVTTEAGGAINSYLVTVSGQDPAESTYDYYYFIRCLTADPGALNVAITQVVPTSDFATQLRLAAAVLNSFRLAPSTATPAPDPLADPTDPASAPDPSVSVPPGFFDLPPASASATAG